jgi:hypothetical protein
MAVDLSIHPSGIVPVLQNVVATVNLGCRLDLKEIALHARNAEYNPKVPIVAATEVACGALVPMHGGVLHGLGPTDMHALMDVCSALLPSSCGSVSLRPQR